MGHRLGRLVSLVQGWGTCGLLWPIEKTNVNYKRNSVTNSCKITIKTILSYRLRPSWGMEIANVAFTPKNVPHP